MRPSIKRTTTPCTRTTRARTAAASEHARTHARTLTCQHARTHARTHARARAHAHIEGDDAAQAVSQHRDGAAELRVVLNKDPAQARATRARDSRRVMAPLTIG